MAPASLPDRGGGQFPGKDVMSLKAFLVVGDRSCHSTPAETAKGRLTQNRSHHRRCAVPLLLEEGSSLGPAQPPYLSGGANPTILLLELLPEPPQATTLLPHIAGEGDFVDTDPPPLLLGDGVRDAGGWCGVCILLFIIPLHAA